MAEGNPNQFSAGCVAIVDGKEKRSRYVCTIEPADDPRKARCIFTVSSGMRFEAAVSGNEVLLERSQLRSWAEQLLQREYTARCAPHQALPKELNPRSLAEERERFERQFGPPRKRNDRRYLEDKDSLVCFGSIVLKFDGARYVLNTRTLSFLAACELAAYVCSDASWDEDPVKAAPHLRVREVKAWSGVDLKANEPVFLHETAGSMPEAAASAGDSTVPAHYNSVLTLLAELVSLIRSVQAGAKDGRVDTSLAQFAMLAETAASELKRYGYQLNGQKLVDRLRSVADGNLLERRAAVEQVLTRLRDQHLAELRREFEKLTTERQELERLRAEIDTQRSALAAERAELERLRQTPVPAQESAPPAAQEQNWPEQVQRLLAAHKAHADQESAAIRESLTKSISEVEELWLQASELIERLRRLEAEAPASTSSALSTAAESKVLQGLIKLLAEAGIEIRPAVSSESASSVSPATAPVSTGVLTPFSDRLADVERVLGGIADKIQRARDPRPEYASSN